MEKALVAQKLANKLFATEAAVDAAMEQTMTLISGVSEARRELGLAATVGNDVTAKLAEALAALADARTAVVHAHGQVADLKLRVGIRTKMIGIMDKPPEGATNPLADASRDRHVA